MNSLFVSFFVRIHHRLALPSKFRDPTHDPTRAANMSGFLDPTRPASQLGPRATLIQRRGELAPLIPQAPLIPYLLLLTLRYYDRRYGTSLHLLTNEVASHHLGEML